MTVLPEAETHCDHPETVLFYFQSYALISMVINAVGNLPAEAYFSEQLQNLKKHDKTGPISYLDTLRGQIAELDEAEPADMESEEYEDWGQRHEDLEDLVDDVLDRLEELE